MAVIQESPDRTFACGVGCCCCGVPAFVGLIILLCSITTLGPEEQMLIKTKGGTGRDVVNGPKSAFLVGPWVSKEFRTAIRLSPQQYCLVTNKRTGVPRHISGGLNQNGINFLGAWDEYAGTKDKIVLQARQYTRLVDSFTGQVRLMKGPAKIVPSIYEKATKGIQNAYLVRSTESLVILNKTSGRKRLFRDEGIFIPDPFEEVAEVRNATILLERNYAVIKDSYSGVYRHVSGPTLLFVKAYEVVVSVRPKIFLQQRDYVRLIDRFSGAARIVKGSTTLVPVPAEDGPGGITHKIDQAIIITSQISVILLNITSGKKLAVTEQGLFFPGPYERIVEVRKALVLKSHEYAVLRDDKLAKYAHFTGPMQLSVGPYSTLYKVLPKVVLQRMDYVRLVDRRTGEEIVVKGPKAVVPDPSQCEKDYKQDCRMRVEQAVVMKADISVLVLNRTSGTRRVARANSGGMFVPVAYEDVAEVRNATVLKQRDYAVVKSLITGVYSHSVGPMLLHLGAYDVLMSVTYKVILDMFGYIRLVNEVTGVERIVKGPTVLVPDSNEVSVKAGANSKVHHSMVIPATLVNKDNAVLVLNKTTGKQRLIQMEGMWMPGPYEYLVELRPRIRVMANEAVIVRDHNGVMTVYDGTAGSSGTNFFLQARSQVVRMSWSVYGFPDDDGTALITKESIQKIDMRIQRTFFSYVVRTKDNVQLSLMGTIFWRVTNVTKMIYGTSDPSGDVWLHCRSSFLQAVSQVSFNNFMGSFNTLAKSALLLETGAANNFYVDRGVKLISLEVTRFEAVDAETKATLRKINEETTNQITLLKKQEGQNAVRAAKMRSDNKLAGDSNVAELSLEGHKKNLIKKRTFNNLLIQAAKAQSDAQPFAQHARSFMAAMLEDNVTIKDGLNLYSGLRGAEHHNKDTANLASGKATLFLTSADVGLNFRSLNLGGGNGSMPLSMGQMGGRRLASHEM